MCVSCTNLRLMEFQTFYHLSPIAAQIRSIERVIKICYLKFLHLKSTSNKINKRRRRKKPARARATTFSSICSISMDSESNTCSFKSGAVSADVLGIVDVPILLYATSFMSISFSNLRACFRRTLSSQHQQKEEEKHPNQFEISFFFEQKTIEFNQFLPSQSDVPIVIVSKEFLLLVQ